MQRFFEQSPGPGCIPSAPLIRHDKERGLLVLFSGLGFIHCPPSTGNFSAVALVRSIQYNDCRVQITVKIKFIFPFSLHLVSTLFLCRTRTFEPKIVTRVENPGLLKYIHQNETESFFLNIAYASINQGCGSGGFLLAAEFNKNIQLPLPSCLVLI